MAYSAVSKMDASWQSTHVCCSSGVILYEPECFRSSTGTCDGLAFLRCWHDEHFAPQLLSCCNGPTACSMPCTRWHEQHATARNGRTVATRVILTSQELSARNIVGPSAESLTLEDGKARKTQPGVFFCDGRICLRRTATLFGGFGSGSRRSSGLRRLDGQLPLVSFCTTLWHDGTRQRSGMSSMQSKQAVWTEQAKDRG